MNQSTKPAGEHHWFVSAQYTQIAAVYDTAQEAQEAVQAVCAESEINARQLTIVDPMDSQFSRKLEGASAPIGQSMWHSHLILGGVGLIIGLVLAYILVNWGPAFTQNSPMFTFLALISPGLFIGLFVAGLFSLRPDRTQIIDTVKKAIRHKHYAVVVNLKKHQSVSRVTEILSRKSNKVVEAIQ